MYSPILRKENILPFAVLASSLYMSVYSVARGQVLPPSGEASGICLIRNSHTSIPGFYAPDIGNGYAKVAKPGVNTFAGIREACTKSDFDALLRSYCAQNPTDTKQYGPEVVGFDKAGNGLASGGCPACDQIQFHRCPLPSPSAEEKTLAYPIPELGGCGDAKECHAYCEKPENNRACFGYVKKHKLIPQDELDTWEDFLDVATGGGPGGCKNEKECIDYCEDASHIVECTDFVARHNLASPQELAEMQKIAIAVRVGAKLPGNCRNKTECISYCENSVHIEECLSFLQEAGFMTVKEAGLVRKYKGTSPGDCAKGQHSFAEAQRSCNAFCNDPTNQPICFKFLQEAGIMTAEEATQAGSLSDFQACIPSAPQEIHQCFIDNLGQDLFNAMKQGVVPLEGNIEDFMVKIRAARQCVNRFADQTLATFTDNPEASACINSELGKDYLQKAKRGEVKCGDAAQSQKRVTSCIEKALSTNIDHCFSLACSEATTCLKSFENMEQEQKGNINPDLKIKIEGKLNACVMEEIRSCLYKDCPEMTACINKLQEGGEQQKGEGGYDPALEQEITVKMTACTKSEQKGQQPSSWQQPPVEQVPQQNSPPIGQIPQEYCSGFASVPSCSYVGSPDSDNYRYCKQCYPDK